MLSSFRSVCLLALLLTTQPVLAHKLRLVADIWPPFTDASMANGGLATELVTTALTNAGYTTEFEQVPWARAMLGLSEGRYDVLINAWYSDERTQIGVFSSGYWLNRIMFIKRKNVPVQYHGDLAAFYAASIAVVRGYAYAPAFDIDDQLHKVPVHNFSMAVRMLAAERVDLTLEDELVARYFLQREPQAVRDRLEFLPEPLTENRLRILVSLKTPDHDKIVAAFDREIDAMKANGSYDRLMKRYGM